MTKAARISTKKLQICELLGEGNFGNVYKGDWYTRGQWMRVAVKLIDLDMVSYEDVCNEANFMKQPEDKDKDIGVVICYGVAEYGNATAIVMQHMALGKINRLVHVLNIELHL